MNTVTLKDIKAHSPCKDGWEKLLKHLGKTKCDSEPLELVEILKSNGIDDAIWCLRALPKEMDGKIRLFNCLIAERALQYWEKQYPDDKRPHEAIAMARKFAAGAATEKELAAAWYAARDAAWDAARAPAWDAARAAARAAAGDAAWDAARAAAWYAARAAAGDAAWDAAHAAARDAARDAAGDAAGDAARDAERKAQEGLFIQYWGSQPAEKGE